MSEDLCLFCINDVIGAVYGCIDVEKYQLMAIVVAAGFRLAEVDKTAKVEISRGIQKSFSSSPLNTDFNELISLNFGDIGAGSKAYQPV
jgi:hypothetical protein